MAVSELDSLLFLFGVPILFFGFAFFWHVWITGRRYREFPSFRLDAEWLFKMLTGQYPKNVSSSSVLFQEIAKNSQRFYKEGLCVMWLLRPYLLVYNENIMKIFANETALVNKSSIYQEAFKDLIGNGLLSSSGKLWSNHRKLLNPAFSLGVLKGYMHIFNKNAKVLVKKFQSTEGKPTEDMLSILKRCTFEILAASIFYLNVKEERLESRAEVFINLIDEAIELVMYKTPRPWLNWPFVSNFFSTKKKYKEMLQISRMYVDEIIDDLINTYTTSGIQEKDSDNEMEVGRTLPQVLVKQHLEDPTFTREYLRDHFINFIVGGYDTVSNALMWCLYILGHHPEVQKEACNEIESVVRAKDVTYDELGKLKYLECVIKESLRLYSTAPIYGRKLSKDIRYGKYTIPRNAEVIFFPFLLHRNPNIYPEPTQFKPERFADSSNVRQWMHIPFGLGLRDCIGKKFAMMEMKVLLVHILREFQIKSLDTVADEDLDWTILLRPTKPLRMLFEARQPNNSQTCHELMHTKSRTLS